VAQTMQPRSGSTAAHPEPSGWAVGWTVFAGIMMVTGGLWWIMAGFIALLNDDFFVRTQEYVLQFDLTSWGWIHLILGAVIMAAGFALFSGATWARAVGLIVSAIAMVAAFAWLPYYPLFAILFIASSVFVIWAIAAHGGELRGDPVL
jgi:hypothetical protein